MKLARLTTAQRVILYQIYDVPLLLRFSRTGNYVCAGNRTNWFKSSTLTTLVEGGYLNYQFDARTVELTNDGRREALGYRRRQILRRIQSYPHREAFWRGEAEECQKVLDALPL